MNKKLVLLSNCILNNQDQSKELIKFLADYEIGIVQLPCPKLASGINITSKKKCTRAYRNYCRELSEKIIKEIENYHREKYEILGVVGIEFSTNCGVYKFTNGTKPWGRGIFIEELEKQMESRRLQIPFFGFDSKNALSTMNKFQMLLKNS